jgi:hypothetical protein
MGRLATSLVVGAVLSFCLLGSAALKAQSPSDFFNIMGSIAREAQRAEGEKRRERQLVMRVQQALGQLGFYDGQVDGVYGKGTEAALARYKQSIGRSPYAELTVADIERMEVAAASASARQGQTAAEIVYNPIGTVDGASDRDLGEVRSGGAFKLQMPEDAAWIVTASGENLDQVLKAGNLYAVDFLSTVVVGSSNGRFAILLGWLPKQEARQLRDALKSLELIPPDAFLSSGEKFLGTFWLIDHDKVSSRQALLQFAQFRPAPQFWSHALASGSNSLPSLKYSSQIVAGDSKTPLIDLRDKPSTTSVRTRRLPAGVPLRINRELGDWKEVISLTGAAGWVAGNSVVSLNTEASDNSEGNENDTVENKPYEMSKTEEVRRAGTRQEAEILLSDLRTFLKEHSDFPDIVTLADEAARLQGAINAGNTDQIQASAGIIRKTLGKSQDFQAFASKRDAERQEARRKALTREKDLARKNMFFLRRYIAENITSENVPRLSQFLKEYDGILASDDPDALGVINESLESQISTSNLKADYQRLVAIYVAEPQAQAPANRAEQQLNITDRTRVLAEGAPDDGIVLFNASGRAPNVVKDLKGNIVFEHDRAIGCSYHPISQASSRYVVAVRALLKAQGVNDINIGERACPEKELDKYDFIVALRDELLKVEKARLIVLAELVEAERYQLFDIISPASLPADAGSIESADAIESGIVSGEKVGFGAIKVKNASTVLCVVIGQQQLGPHAAIIDANTEIFVKAFNGKPGLLTTRLEAAFIALKRDQCGGLYAESRDLKGVVEALKRDKLDFVALPFWADERVVEKAQGEASESAKVEAETAAAVARKATDQQAIDAKKAADVARTKVAREEVLRRENGARAGAGQAALSKLVDAMLKGTPDAESMIFPQTSLWLRTLTGDGWEYVGLTEAVSDFGVSNWKERKLDTVVVDFSFSFKNRVLGENKVYCRSLGIVIDGEFDMPREPVEDECRDGNPTIANWKLGRKFMSQWIAD